MNLAHHGVLAIEIVALAIVEGSCNCEEVEDVQGVLTLFCSGAAQVCHALRVEERREQLEVEEEDGDRQEEEEEVESGEGESRRVRHVDDHGWSVKALRT